MEVLWINLALVFTLAFSARYFAILKFAPVGIFEYPNKFLILCTSISLIFVSGLRNNIGDTYFYIHSYKTSNFTWETIQKEKDIGFGILQMILKKYSDDPQLLIFMTAMITNGLIIYVFYKYSKKIEISLFVYITGGLFLISMNGVRQFLAASIIFFGTKYLINKNWIKYFSLIIIASTFHGSAIIFIPIYFLVGYKAWTKTTFIFLFLTVLIILGFNEFSNVLFSAIQETQYGVYTGFNEGGANTLRVLVNAAPLMIAYLGREKLKAIFPESDYFVNLSLIGLFFLMISTQNWIFARFSIYFTLYQLILISWIIGLFKERDRKFVYFSLCICYLFYFYYEHVVSLNIIYESDYL